MGTMPRVVAYTIGVFAFIAIGLPVFIFLLKSGIGIVGLTVAAGIGAYVLYIAERVSPGGVHDS